MNKHANRQRSKSKFRFPFFKRGKRQVVIKEPKDSKTNDQKDNLLMYDR